MSSSIEETLNNLSQQIITARNKSKALLAEHIALTQRMADLEKKALTDPIAKQEFIRINKEMVEKLPKDEEVKKVMNEVTKASDRMMSMINTLSNIASEKTSNDVMNDTSAVTNTKAAKNRQFI